MRQVSLKDTDGTMLLDREIEVPLSWSETAATIAAYKYLRKRGVNSPEGMETSIRQLVYRVAHTIRTAGEKLGHFASKDEADVFEDELKYILVTQRAAFNSPVWFNVGLFHEYGIVGNSQNWFWNPESNEVEVAVNAYEHPQASACFIQSVKDDLSDIFDLLKKESQLFKYGSGSGTNFSTLRSRYEKLSGGGNSSGVLSFLNVFNAGAGATKSGGTTRRAAKMVILNVDHPEIMEFIHWKEREEEKAKILIELGGLTSDFNGEAYQTVGGQNSNNSVRVTDEFMQAYVDGGNWDLRAVTTGEVVRTLPARQVMREIAQAAWRCADPGMQYDTTINTWHTCKVTGRINASNPCSEYMFLDDSACNLASINLVKYLADDGKLDIEAYRHTVDVIITAQEILVDFSSFPGRAIAQNSHEYRPLGLGYANLGAYLMRVGLPYDSDGGRAFAAAVTAIMTGRAYAQSARIAGRIGAFPGFAKNRESMLDVIKMHRNAAYQIDNRTLTEELFAAAKQDWDDALAIGEKNGYRNAQATVLAPTGTIGPLMDADTTGIEPDFALVKYKKLAGGGGYSIVNQSVVSALEQLGYNPTETKEINDYILEQGTIEGAPHVRSEHLAVFDCANRVGNGTRFIRPMAHVDMMSAVQPFLSGAISKTVNMPEEVTVEDIEEVYVEAWKKGIKALALYRDNCKASQPLTVKKKDEEESAVQQLPKLQEAHMPKTRHGITHSFVVGNHKVYITANHYTDGRLGEIFLKTAREGSAFSGLMDTLARLLSKALQRGESVDSLIDSLINMRFEPWGPTDDMEIPFAKSIPDYIARWIGRHYLSIDKQVMMGIIGEDVAKSLAQADISNVDVKDETAAQESPEPMPVQATLEMMSETNGDVKETSAPPCPTCGAFMVRNGTCYSCRECGTTTGCS
jgi:ribonucleoside-diphosphate reductase alpha chain